jgi:agmatinase
MGLSVKEYSRLNAGEIGIIGVPLDENSSFLRGPAKAPQLIIDAIESDSANYYTEDLKNLEEHPRVFWCGNVAFDNYMDIGTPISHMLESGAIPFTLGGDHSIAYPIIRAVSAHYSELNIIQFDAHGDLYDELGGNRHSHASPFARIMENDLAKSLTQVGIRTMTQHQKEQANRFQVNVIEMRNWTPEIKLDINGPVYITFDMDVLDPAFAPGVSHHEPGGLSTREALRMIQQLDVDIVGCDVVEYNPDRDINGVTVMTAAKIVKELLAQLL